MSTIILGDGNLGHAIAAAVTARGDPAPRLLGRPCGTRHAVEDLEGVNLVFDASHGVGVRSNVDAALAAGCRQFVIATTGWDADRATVDDLLRSADAAAVAAPNFSLGAALFMRLVDTAGAMYGRLPGFDPYIVEWHRRNKADRPSGTARELAHRLIAAHATKRRIGDASAGPPAEDELEVVGIRAGASPGSHVVGFDAQGESVELRIAARDRSAYAAGALAAADWLLRATRRPGLHTFDDVVDELLATPAEGDHPATPSTEGHHEMTTTTTGTHPTAASRAESNGTSASTARSDGLTPVMVAHGTDVSDNGHAATARVSGPTTTATRPTLRGALTALITPFTADGSLDERALRTFVRWQVLAGIDGLVPCGTTGETPTLSAAERDRVIAITVETVSERPSRSRISIVAGTGTNDTRGTIEGTRRAAALGADAALVVAPYYNRPDARMLEAHFRAVADEGDLPIVVYNVPSRTGTNVPADVFLRLAEHPRVIATKEASGNLEQIATICRDRPRDVAVLAGDDAWTLAVMAMGGDGVVSVASNEIPGEVASLTAAARAGDWEAARRIHARCLALFLANFRGGPNPVPVKAALALMGLLPSDATRLPLLPLDTADRNRLATLLREMGLIDSGGRFRPVQRSTTATAVPA